MIRRDNGPAFPLSNTRIIALIDLLGDENTAVARAARTELMRAGRTALEAIEAAASADGPRLRLRARQLLDVVRTTVATEDLAALLATGEPDLETALVLLAQTEHPILRADEVGAALDELAHGVNVAKRAMNGPEASVHALVHELFAVRGFSGRAAELEQIESSLIDEVLRTRRGIPVSLAAVAMLVGRRCGLSMAGIGTPGHFLVQIGDGSRQHVLDACSGKLLTRAACRALLAGFRIEFKDEFLATVPDKELLKRTLRNLHRLHMGREDDVRVQRVRTLLAAAGEQVP